MFTLSIETSADGLNSIKSELTRKLPDVKSSHRCEAIARGLGFQTYAAALAFVNSGKQVTNQVQGRLFAKYLTDHGFDVQPNYLYIAAAKVALRAVAHRMPRLTAAGIGCGQPSRKEGGGWEDTQDLSARFQRYRQELTSDAAAKPFLTSLALLSRVTFTKNIQNGTSSYWLKHVAERYVTNYPEGEKLGPVYVANGILIAAALHAGFKIRTGVDELGYDNLNVSFNMSKSCLKDIDCEVRPDGGVAQDRRHREQMKRNRFHPFGSATF